MGWCLEMARFLSLFRHKDQFQMVELAENLQLSNLWLHSTADHRWMILVLFFLGSKLTQAEIQCEPHVFSWIKNTTDTSVGLKFGWKTNRIPRDYKIKDNEFAPFSIFSTKNQALIRFSSQDWRNKKTKHIKQMWLQEDFSSVVDTYYLHMNNLF